MPSTSPTLWVVATPLGNPGDFSPRAREAVTGAALVLAEDTRRAGQLFQRCGVSAARMMSFHDHNEQGRIAAVLEVLAEEGDVALVSDAGTPLMSDPGYRLVRACREAGIRVSPVPGPSAPVTALCACGLPPHPYTFLGFLPRKRGEQVKLLKPFASVKTTLVFFERKTRLKDTLEAALEALGPRELCVSRELTKTHEEFILSRLEKTDELPDELLGEITVVIGPPEDARSDEADIDAVIAEESEAGGRPKEIARRVKERVPGWSVKEIYERMQS